MSMHTDHLAQIDAFFMRMCIAEGQKSEKVSTAYCVGAVLVRSSPTVQEPESKRSAFLVDVSELSRRVVSTGFSRELPGNTHAEECCLIRAKLLPAADVDARPKRSDCDAGSELTLTTTMTMYTTMEPCSRRLSGKGSCTDNLISLKSRGLRRVVVGTVEPSVFVERCEGLAKLKAAGLDVTLLPGFAGTCDQLNSHLTSVATRGQSLSVSNPHSDDDRNVLDSAASAASAQSAAPNRDQMHAAVTVSIRRVDVVERFEPALAAAVSAHA